MEDLAKDTIAAALDMARILVQQGKTPAAVAALEHALAQFPDSQALARLG
jgi:uncharacterized protein HemY